MSEPTDAGYKSVNVTIPPELVEQVEALRETGTTSLTLNQMVEKGLKVVIAAERKKYAARIGAQTEDQLFSEFNDYVPGYSR